MYEMTDKEKIEWLCDALINIIDELNVNCPHDRFYEAKRVVVEVQCALEEEKENDGR